MRRWLVLVLVCGWPWPVFGQVIGYGWATSALPAKNQEWFYMGFGLGLQERFRGNPKEVVQLLSDNSGSPSGAVPIARQLLRDGVSVLTGFTTSHDALLVNRVLQDTGYAPLVLYIGPGHASLAHAGETVYTTGESMHQTAESMLDFARRKFPGGRGLVVSNIEAVFSVNNRDLLQQQTRHKRYRTMRLDFVSLDALRKLDNATMRKIAAGQYQYLMMTAYAEECSDVLAQLATASTHYPIIANSSWTSVELLRRLLAERRAPTYISSLWVKGGRDSLMFEQQVKRKYGIEANAELSYGYDAGLILGETMNRVRGPSTPQALIRAFRSDLCFHGTSTGRICFGPHGGHAKRVLYFVRFSVTKGFELLKDGR